MSRRKFNLNWKQALAEIALIFVGITLAITFQTWNEQWKDNLLLQGYYERLVAELEQDSDDLIGIIGYNNQRVEGIEKFFSYLDNNPKPHLDSIQNFIQTFSYHMNTYVPNENTYKELISTGNIKLIPTNIRELLLRLSQMHAYVDATQTSFIQRYDNRRDQMAEVVDESSFYNLRKNSDLRTLRWQRDLNSEGYKRYTNLLAVRLRIGRTLIEIYGSLNARCEELAKLVELKMAK